MADLSNWDDRYRRGEFIGSEPSAIIVQAASLLPAGRALDVACGAGRNAVFLAQLGWNVTGVDGSAAGLDLARTLAKTRGVIVEWRQADLEHGAEIEPQAFDLICVIQYLQRDLFNVVREGVRPGGIVAASIAMVDNSPDVKPMNPAYLLNPGELRGLFADWELLFDAETRSDTGHKRMTADIIARKPLIPTRSASEGADEARGRDATTRNSD